MKKDIIKLIGNQEQLIEVVDDNEEIEISYMPQDYLNIEYQYDESTQNKVKINIQPKVPVTSLSNKFKGDIGENLANTILMLSREDTDNLYYITKPSCTFDIGSHLAPIKFDVKSGYETRSEEGKATAFNFHLATNKAGINGIQISPKKYKKNYEAEGIHYLILICIYNDPNKTPKVYMIPTSSPVVRNNTKIAIPASGKSKYSKYELDISSVMGVNTDYGDIDPNN